MKTKALALCGILTALGVTIMLLGGLLGIGTYAAPMYAALCLLPVGQLCGKKWQTLVWVATGVLSLILVADVEQNLFYLCVFGGYPLVRPWLQKRPKLLRILLKAAFFNGAAIALELLVIWVLVPEVLGLWYGLLLLAIGNLVFWLYDWLLPAMERVLVNRLRKLF